MRFTLDIKMKNSEGVLERVLGRLRQRNLNIHALTASCSSDFSKIEAKITVESERNAESIMKQLDKLYDVQTLNVLYLHESTNQNLDYIEIDSTPNNPIGEQNEVCLSV